VKRVSDRFLQLGVLAALIGMTMGVIMGAKEDFTLAPAHAHLNLLGWASMMLYGLFYRVVPKAAENRLAGIHFWVAVLAVVVLIPSLAMFLLGHKEASPVLGVASVCVLLSMLIFAVIVFQATSARSAPAAQPKTA
jgi:cbb3-type cytochrome oxidase subunit 1